MASVHQKQPVPKVAVSILSEAEVLVVEFVIGLFSFFVFTELLSFCAQEFKPIKLTTEINKNFNMVYDFFIYLRKGKWHRLYNKLQQQKFNKQYMFKTSSIKVEYWSPVKVSSDSYRNNDVDSRTFARSQKK